MQNDLVSLLAARKGHFHVAIVNDVVNPGSAVRGTFAELKACGAQPAVIGALLVLGTSASSCAASEGVPLESIASLPNPLWPPSDRPLCTARVPLDNGAEESLGAL